MKRYTLVVHIPCDKTYDKVSEALRTKSYKKTFWHSIVPPHKIEYEFDFLSEKGVESYKEMFRDLLKDSRFKGYCTFKVKEEKVS
jgi:hypothetical protein